MLKHGKLDMDTNLTLLAIKTILRNNTANVKCIKNVKASYLQPSDRYESLQLLDILKILRKYVFKRYYNHR